MTTSTRVNQWVLSGTGTANTTQTLTRAAPAAGQRHVVTGFRVSSTGAIATAGLCNVRFNAVTILDSVGILVGNPSPVAVNAPINGLPADEATSVDITIGPLGVGISSRLVLIGYTEYV